jgi:hypothetical protein
MSLLVLIRTLVACPSSQGPYPAMHLLNILNSSIIVAVPVTGAVHVTSCHCCRFEWQSQQLRLHESTDLKCFTTAATILEDCRRIVFYYAAVEKAPDVKDFSFLKEGVPSPNFTVEQVWDSQALPTIQKEIQPMVPFAAPQNTSSPDDLPPALMPATAAQDECHVPSPSQDDDEEL